jgi:agmatine deiminase
MSQIPLRMPAEWEPHRATWIAWPYAEDDFPGKIETVSWVYTEIVRILSQSERVEILCHTHEIAKIAKELLARSSINNNFCLHVCPYDRTWVRDSGPVLVKGKNNSKFWIKFGFNGWAKYDNFKNDQGIPRYISDSSKVALKPAIRHEDGRQFILEGGAIDVDGEGTLLATEECLLSNIQCRNSDYTKELYAESFLKYLGVEKIIWLPSGCEGDDTHGHIDDVARFVAPAKVVVAYEENPDDANHLSTKANLEALRSARDARGRPLEIFTLPFPSPTFCDGVRLPSSYLNFYIANSIVLVPTFNDANDKVALETLSSLFPERKVVGLYCGDLVLGYGTIHCSTQQEPI